LQSVLSQKDKEIYIFDEASGNLDVEKQKEFKKKLEILSKKKLEVVMNAA